MGDFKVDVAALVDPLSSVMLLVVTIVSFLVHVYAIGYMEHDHGFYRFFTWLPLFVFAMLILVLADNYLLMFVGWEGVGLCSYLLIGFWHDKKSASDAGKKAFIVNRLGDVGVVLGVLLLFGQFGTIDFQEVAGAVSRLDPETTFGPLSLITLLLFVGATGKSAQIPLHVWLPDAMEGPTPVSALIHAATMVTAGVYMIGRNAVLFSHAPHTLALVAVVGATTALLAGTVALVQNDIKRVLAYSTVSQLGYMFLAMGVGAFGAGVFHLFTHAFFKALLFLGSGAVIHALAGEQDLRRMGGLKRDLPVTYWTFLVGTLAIAGLPGLAGFFSKDEILYRAYAGGHQVLWLVGLVTSLLTAVYMFRVVFLAFHGQRRTAADAAHAHLHDAPRPMAFALVVLAVGSILAGYVGLPAALGGRDRLGEFLESSFTVETPAGQERAVDAPEAPAGAVGREGSHGAELALMGVSTAAAFGGMAIAFVLFFKNRDAASRLADRFAALRTLWQNAYWVDRFYDQAIVQPIGLVSRAGLWKIVDVRLIDGAVNGVGRSAVRSGSLLRRVQTGSVRAYAASLLLGVVLVLGYYAWR